MSGLWFAFDTDTHCWPAWFSSSCFAFLFNSFLEWECFRLMGRAPKGQVQTHCVVALVLEFGPGLTIFECYKKSNHYHLHKQLRSKWMALYLSKKLAFLVPKQMEYSSWSCQVKWLRILCKQVLLFFNDHECQPTFFWLPNAI